MLDTGQLMSDVSYKYLTSLGTEIMTPTREPEPWSMPRRIASNGRCPGGMIAVMAHTSSVTIHCYP